VVHLALVVEDEPDVLVRAHVEPVGPGVEFAVDGPRPRPRSAAEREPVLAVGAAADAGVPLDRVEVGDVESVAPVRRRDRRAAPPSPTSRTSSAGGGSPTSSAVTGDARSCQRPGCAVTTAS